MKIRSNKFSIVIVSIIFIVVVVLPIIAFKLMAFRSYDDVLSYYGFTTKEQKQAIIYLLKAAKVNEDDAIFKRNFLEPDNHYKYPEGILHLVKTMQKYFIVRSGIQERWNITSQKWIEDSNQIDVLKALKTLGLVDQINPHAFKKYDAICILGSTLDSMKIRIKFTKDLLNKNIASTNEIILLAGERSVSTVADGGGSKDELLAIAKKYNIKHLENLTETELIKYAYDIANFDISLKVHVIDTPKYELSRPTTQTTIIELNDWLKSHSNIKSMLFISDQPHVKYQEAVIEQTLKTLNSNLSFEVVGPAAPNVEKISSMLEALGSYIWVKSPQILSQFKLSKELKNEFKGLYVHHPLMLSSGINLFDD